MSRHFLSVVFLFATSLSILAQGPVNTIRVGAFPNITHAQAMVGKANGWFEKAMGPQRQDPMDQFQCRPVGDRGHVRWRDRHDLRRPESRDQRLRPLQGEALRVVAGAASGGASLVVRNDAGINKPEDFHGKRVASPQFGNTQDVALRNGSRTTA